MRRATNFTSFPQHSTRLNLKFWFKNGENFGETFDLQTTTFDQIKLFVREKLSRQIDDFQLISIDSKRIIDEKEKLSDLNLRDGAEFLLIEKSNRQKQTENSVENEKADAITIENRTKILPVSSRPFVFFPRPRLTDEFRVDITRILVSLIETSQKLLWFHPDAEKIFERAEEILLGSSETPTETIRSDLVKNLLDMGFSERQAQRSLKRTNNDFQSAMEFLLNQSNSIDDDNDEEQEGKSTKSVRLFNRNGPFISVGKFQEENFRANSTALKSLKEMGFEEKQIAKALRMFNNNQNLACDFLLSDETQQKKFEEHQNDRMLDPNSRLFQAIVENAVVQRTLNIPKTFFVLLQLSENSGSIANFMNDPDIAHMLVEISRIYHSEKENFVPQAQNQAERNSRQPSTSSDSD